MLQILLAVIAFYSVIRIELRSCHIGWKAEVVRMGNLVDIFNLSQAVLFVKIFVEILFNHIINLGFCILKNQAPPFNIPHKFGYCLKVFIQLKETTFVSLHQHVV
ncbi:hypothetical protein D3C78_893440 [compost metagenome]